MNETKFENFIKALRIYMIACILAVVAYFIISIIIGFSFPSTSYTYQLFLFNGSLGILLCKLLLHITFVFIVCLKILKCLAEYTIPSSPIFSLTVITFICILITVLFSTILVNSLFLYL